MYLKCMKIRKQLSAGFHQWVCLHTGMWQTPPATDGSPRESEHSREFLHWNFSNREERWGVPAGQNVSPARGSGSAELKPRGQQTRTVSSQTAALKRGVSGTTQKIHDIANLAHNLKQRPDMNCFYFFSPLSVKAKTKTLSTGSEPGLKRTRIPPPAPSLGLV